jgi:predicted GNAT family N-acyltransferase
LEESKEKRKFIFEPLGSTHDRAAFACEEPALQNYLRTQARQDAYKKLAAVFIMTEDGKTIAGFYTLSHYAIRSSEIPEAIKNKLTKHDQIPATLIGRLARHTAYRGTGAGDLLMVDALKRCLDASKQAASWAVVVEAKNAAGTAFYKIFGFEAFSSQPLKLFILTATIEQMF